MFETWRASDQRQSFSTRPAHTSERGAAHRLPVNSEMSMYLAGTLNQCVRCDSWTTRCAMVTRRGVDQMLPVCQDCDKG